MSVVNIQAGEIAGLDKLEDTVLGATRFRGRVTGTRANLSKRFELGWVAGQRGKPAVNADILDLTEAVNQIADPDFEVLGTNGVTTSTSFNAEGGVKCTTAGASGDQVILAPHLDANESAWNLVTWGSDKEVIWEAHISTGANITAATIWAGLKLTNTDTKITDNDQVYFRYQDTVNSGIWEVVSSIGGVDTSTNTATPAVAVSTAYHFKISIDDGRVAKCYLNGELVATTAALTDTTDFKPYIGVSASAIAVKTLDVYGQAISRVLG